MLNPNSLYFRLMADDLDIREQAQKDYHEWINHPVTREIKEVLNNTRDVMVELPLPHDGADGNSLASAQRMWMIHGLHLALKKLFSLDQFALESRRQAEQANAEISTAHDDFHYPHTTTQE